MKQNLVYKLQKSRWNERQTALSPEAIVPTVAFDEDQLPAQVLEWTMDPRQRFQKQ